MLVTITIMIRLLKLHIQLDILFTTEQNYLFLEANQAVEVSIFFSLPKCDIEVSSMAANFMPTGNYITI